MIAATAKSLQSCPTLCNPIDSSPPGSPVPGILQARTLEWVAISFSNAWKWKVKGKSLGHVQFLVTPWTAAYQAPPSMGFSRQEYWSGEPLPSSTQTHNAGLHMTPMCFYTSQVALVVKKPPANAGDARHVDLIPGLGWSLGVGNGTPLKYSCLENSMDRGAWRAVVHRTAKSQTQLSEHRCVSIRFESVNWITENCDIFSFKFQAPTKCLIIGDTQ